VLRIDQTRLSAALRFSVFVPLYLLFAFLAAWVAVPLARSLGIAPLTQTLLETVAVGFTAAALATALLLGAVDDRPLSYIGLGFSAGWGRQLAAGFLLGAGMIGVIVLSFWATGHLHYVPSSATAGGIARRIVWIFVLFLFGALHEELLFRGYPFQRLIEVVGAPVAVVLLAAGFGAIHTGNPHTSILGAINTALVGILFAVAYLRTARLWLPIGLHWSWNFLEGASGLPVSGITIDQLPWAAEVSGRTLFHGGAYGPEASLPATLVIVAVTVVLLSRRPAKPLGTVPRPSAAGN
jgi:membrane protease YdiL (CAAX protease family)